MTTKAFDRNTLLGVAPILVAGAVVLPAAAILGGPSAAVIAACGVSATFAIFVVAESFAKFSGVQRPMERMLLTMAVRGMLAAIAVLAGTAIEGIEPKTIALVAVPLYLSLVAAEAMTATTLTQPMLRPTGGERN